MICDYWYKSILHLREFKFSLFCEGEILFWISRDVWEGQIILRDSVIRKGIGDPSCSLTQNFMDFVSLGKNITSSGDKEGILSRAAAIHANDF